MSTTLSISNPINGNKSSHNPTAGSYTSPRNVQMQIEVVEKNTTKRSKKINHSNNRVIHTSNNQNKKQSNKTKRRPQLTPTTTTTNNNETKWYQPRHHWKLYQPNTMMTSTTTTTTTTTTRAAMMMMMMMASKKSFTKTVIESWLSSHHLHNTNDDCIAREKSETYVVELKPPGNESLFVMEKNWNSHPCHHQNKEDIFICV